MYFSEHTNESDFGHFHLHRFTFTLDYYTFSDTLSKMYAKRKDKLGVCRNTCS